MFLRTYRTDRTDQTQFTAAPNVSAVRLCVQKKLEQRMKIPQKRLCSRPLTTYTNYFHLK